MLYIKNSVHTKWKAEMARIHLFISVYLFFCSHLCFEFLSLMAFIQYAKIIVWKKSLQPDVNAATTTDDDENHLEKRSLKRKREKNGRLQITFATKNGVYLIYIQIIDTKTTSRFYSFKCKRKTKSHLDFGISNRMVRIKYYTHPLWLYALPPNYAHMYIVADAWIANDCISKETNKLD